MLTFIALPLFSALLASSADAELTRNFIVGVNGCDNAATQQLCTPVLPKDPVLPVGSVALLDLLLLGGNPDDLVQANFCPPDPIFPTDPIRLACWDGALWSPVFNSDGAPAAYASTTNSFPLDFTVTSTPKVTELNGRSSRLWRLMG
ncbi:hypothetical protein [Nitrosomonas sp. Nm58]|uniref:hypothetical protein n=1 Tax=Nitrosomonas sp. Nm58 TaxID=200126 RepID=UPI000B88E6A1|nr:hypothetical protein [Nitrosomonas sp. Nm58]